MCSDAYQQSNKPMKSYCPECDNPIDEDGVSVADSCYWSDPEMPCDTCGYDFAYCNEAC